MNENKKNKRIGIFGGSFDPPHAGHVKAAKAFADICALDLLFIIPAGEAPLKGHAHRYSPQERYGFSFKAFSEIPQVRVTDIELAQPGTSYTILTVRHFARLFPQDELFLLVGTDQLEKFTQWHDWQKILRLAKLVVFPRDHKPLCLPTALQPFADRVELHPEFEPIDISSTQIRRNT